MFASIKQHGSQRLFPLFFLFIDQQVGILHFISILLVRLELILVRFPNDIRDIIDLNLVRYLVLLEFVLCVITIAFSPLSYARSNPCCISFDQIALIDCEIVIFYFFIILGMMLQVSSSM